MKNIKEYFENRRSIQDLIYEDAQSSQMVDEGLRDLFQKIKKKFKGAVAYLKGIVAKFGSYFIPVNENGDILPAISPLTAGQAYVDGMIKKVSTFVHLDPSGAQITKCRNASADALKLLAAYAMYKSSLKYFQDMSVLLGESASTTIDDLLVSESVSDKIKDFIVENQKNGFQEMINEVKLHTEDPQAKYNIIDDDADLMREINVALKGQSARLMIWGAPGIGKSAILRDVLKTLPGDYRLIIKTLSNETPDNFTLPTYVYKEDGTADKLDTTLVDNGSGNGRYSTKEKGTPIAATDVPKTWMPVYKPTGDETMDAEMDAALGHGLLFIDELSRATPQVLNVILPLVNEGDFNGYKLGSGWTIIVASNREEDEASGQSSIGNALSNRFAQVYYEPTCKTWRKWADKQGYMSPLLLQWLSMPESENLSGGKFYYYDYNDSGEDVNVTKLMCTPRSWTNAMRELACYANTGSLEGFSIFDIDERTIKRVLNKYVPSVAVDSFWAFLSTVSKIGNFDAAVESVWHNGGAGFKVDKKDLNKIMLPLAQLLCSAHSSSLPTKEEWDSLCKWLIGMGSDQLASYVLDVFKNVFMGPAKASDGDDDTTRNTLFISKNVIANASKSASGKTKIAALNTLYKDIFSKWGIKSLDEWPDYSEGLAAMGKKFGAAFSQKIGGKSALG